LAVSTTSTVAWISTSCGSAAAGAAMAGTSTSGKITAMAPAATTQANRVNRPARRAERSYLRRRAGGETFW
jgi:hypothetical protein